ncbi:hypothetical protein, partial [Burkholderia pseudomallei]|uniref:hypothetical protein n=1 Tax=Burkholderia pseudomallei TaxID=28450 RepID=UPI00358F1C9F
ELTLSLQEAGDDIVGHLNYASALFDESTVRRYVTYWCRLLEGMTAGAADQTIVGLPLLDEAERKQVVRMCRWIRHMRRIACAGSWRTASRPWCWRTRWGARRWASWMVRCR